MTKKTRTTLVMLAAVGMLSFGCEGAVKVQADGMDLPTTGGPGGGTDEPPPGTIMRPPGEEVDDEACQFIDPGSTPLRRLTTAEYNQTVRDLLPTLQIPTQTFQADEKVSGFDANVVAPVTELMAEEYQGAAETIGLLAAADMQTVANCNGAAEDQCATAFIADFGKRAFRRPLTTEETTAFNTLYTTLRSEYDFDVSMRLVIEATLQSPNFLYRVEMGVAGADEVIKLNDYEIASRLSYFLWGSMPDAQLLAAADAGELQDTANIERETLRMLADTKARTRINDVFSKWLRLDQLETTEQMDPAWNENLKASMIAETEAFIDHVLWEDDGTVSTLLSADYSFIDAELAGIYGVAAPTEGGLVRTTLPGDRRGLLTHPGVLAAYGHGQMPVHRGKFVRESFFCLTPQEPPNEITPLETFDGESMRSKAEKRMNAQAEGCAGCHAGVDGLGLVFDQYDGVGRYRTEDENGNPLTSEGTVLGTLDSNGDVNGVQQLADRMAESPEVQSCVSRQFFRYAFARMDGGSDACSLHMMQDALAASGNDVKKMLVAVTTTDAFIYRRNPAMAN